MKRAILFPGTGETFESVWFPYIARELGSMQYGVKTLKYPSPEKPLIDELLPIALSENYDEETVLIGHSAGVPLMLAVLEKLDTKVKQVILVAGYVNPLGSYEDANGILKTNYDWEKIKSNANEILIINGVNDPWGCGEEEGRELFKNLGGTLILNHEGHMGSDTYNQPYKEFPFLVKLLR